MTTSKIQEYSVKKQQLADRLKQKGLNIKDMHHTTVSYLINKNPNALNDYFNDLPFKPQHQMSEAEQLEKMRVAVSNKLDFDIPIDNVIIDNRFPFTNNAIKLWEVLVRYASICPGGNPTKARDYYLPVKPGVAVIVNKTVLKQQIGVRTQQEVCEAIDNIWKNEVHLTVKDKASGKTWSGKSRWLSDLGVTGDGDIRFTFNTHLFKLISDLNKQKNTGYTKAPRPAHLLPFRKKLSLFVYRQFGRWSNLPQSKRYYASEFKELANCPTKKTAHFTELLDAAIKEVNHFIAPFNKIVLLKEMQGHKIIFYQWKIIKRTSINIKKQEQNDLFPTLELPKL